MTYRSKDRDEVVGALIQARMGSSRLPGKILELVLGQTLLWRVVERVAAAVSLDQIYVIIPESSEDDKLAAYLDQVQLKYWRGSESDVLDRYYQAAKNLGIDIVVRVTADDPLKDPVIIDQAVGQLKSAGGELDYVANCSYDGSIPGGYPEGLDIEVMTFQCLARVWRNAKKKSEREHVTPYIFNNPSEFKISGFSSKENLSHLRWTVDYAIDLDFVRYVYSALYKGNESFTTKDILRLLEQEKGLSSMNAGISRYEGYTASALKD